MENLPLFDSEPVVDHSFSDESNIVLFHGLATDFLATIPNNSIQLMITSPPYNIGKEYETASDLQDYLDEQQVLISQMVRVLKNTGSICWQVGNYVNDGEVFPLDILFYDMFKRHNLQLRNRIIWHFGHGLHTKKRFSGRYETILWFTKSDNYVFNLDDVRVPSKYPGKRHYKGPNKGKPSGNPKGKNPSDVWEILYQDWDSAFWEIPNVKSNHVEKTEHPCQFPVELVERCVLALSNEEDWVLDPYTGVGSTLVGAMKHNRRAAGSDKEQAYLDIAQERIKAQHNGMLKTRPLGKPVHKPSGKEKVSQRPNEWQNGDKDHAE